MDSQQAERIAESILERPRARQKATREKLERAERRWRWYRAYAAPVGGGMSAAIFTFAWLESLLAASAAGVAFGVALGMAGRASRP